MHIALKSYLEARKMLDIARTAVRAAEKAASWVPLPSKLRPATPEDIVEGAIIWYPGHYIPLEARDPDHLSGGRVWKYVRELDFPGHPFKAYTAEDGCRYGHEGGFIEIE